MKKFMAIFAAAAIILSFSACSAKRNENNSANNSVSTTSAQNTTFASGNSAPTDGGQTADSSDGKILIAYFSYGENADLPDGIDASTSASIQHLDGKVTGNTGLVASYIQKATGGELFSIRTEKTYPDSYNAVINVGQDEKNNNEKPPIANRIENLDDYGIIFVGFPNWWYGMPMVMYTFFDEYDFAGKTIIPFCTSGGSAFSNSIAEIKTAEPNANVLDGLHIGAGESVNAEADVIEWVNGLGLQK